MREIKHVEVKKVGNKVTVSVFCRELSSWADVTFEVDDESLPALFCKVYIHGRGRHSEVTVAPDFVAVEDNGTTISVWCDGEARQSDGD
jgi:hypothetical protein